MFPQDKINVHNWKDKQVHLMLLQHINTKQHNQQFSAHV
jgi:hypothetical protein